MKILLVHIDGKMPNLALMKLSAYFKARGDDVTLMRMAGMNVDLPIGPDFNTFVPDWVYASCVFAKNKGYARRLKDIFSGKVQGLQIGGYGLDHNTSLPEFIEHIMPDYDLYGIDYSMGFTSRGCIRNCPWCIVPKKEGPLRNHAPIEEFWNPRYDKLVLLDNNFLASPKWRKNMNFIIEHKIKTNFNQGLDIRLVNDENAVLLGAIDYHTHTFRSRYLHFAFDDIRLEDQVRRGVETLRRHGIAPYTLMFYVLCGFNSTHEEDMYRFNFLIELGCDPFIMKYDGRDDDLWLNHFARWVNKRIYKSCSWEDYDSGESQEIIKKEEDN